MDPSPVFTTLIGWNTMLVILSACFAGFGTDSFAIGASVFCGLCAIVGAIGNLKD